MNTPIIDFVKKYNENDISRLHMPGHKGRALLGFENLDITEIGGADELYEADGIILESENNASSLFGSAHSYYSAEGSSLTIKAMMNIALQNSGSKNPYIIAARNVHKTFIFGCALLGIEVKWLYPNDGCSLCECPIDASLLEIALLESSEKPIGVYLTSPDYLGNVQDIKSLSKICKAYSVPLLVDNAHGAYLKFLPESSHPLDLGADIVCDSAHKTLPALTGAGYLHISKDAPKEFLDSARMSLSLFASTSPSYLIMQSLDACNAYIADDYKEKLVSTIAKIDKLKEKLTSVGWVLRDTEKLKIVIDAVASNVNGNDIMEKLRSHKVECEFGSFEHIVMMFTPESRDIDFERIFSALSDKSIFKQSSEIPVLKVYPSKIKLGIRQAVLSKSELIPVENSLGRICASPTVSCPPAVPIAISGEVITENAINICKLYGIEKIAVVK
jgi:arginine decarboxylase